MQVFKEYFFLIAGTQSRAFHFLRKSKMLSSGENI